MSTERELVWVDLKGTARPASEVRNAFISKSALSPDGRFVAVALATSGNLDVSVLELERGTLTRLLDWAEELRRRVAGATSR